MPSNPTDYGHQTQAALITAALLVLAIALTYAGRPRGVVAPRWYAVLLGKDGRLSTSKTVALAWTLVVAYILLVLIFNGPDWNVALKHLSPNYLLLLAGPFAALVVAKATVTTRVSNGTLIKTRARDRSVRLADLFNDDDGEPDLFDVQYVIFNVIAIVFVLSTFARASAAGFPEIPSGLVILTAGPAAVYTSNKFFGSDAPIVLAVVPSSVRAGQLFTVTGQNLVLATPAATAGEVTVTVGGHRAGVISVTPTSVSASAPEVGPDAGRPLGVVLQTAAGPTAYLDNALTVIDLAIELYGADTGTATVAQSVTLRGTWPDVPTAVPLVILDGGVLGDVRRHSEGSVVFVVPPLTDLGTTRTVSIKVRAGDRETNAISLSVAPAHG